MQINPKMRLALKSAQGKIGKSRVEDPSFGGGGRLAPFSEQVGNEVIEVVDRYGFGEVVGHEGSFGFSLFLNIFFRYGAFFAGGVGEDEVFSFFAAEEAGLNVAVF